MQSFHVDEGRMPNPAPPTDTGNRTPETAPRDEDLHDMAVIAERREEPAIPFDKLKKKLKKDGLL